MYRKNIAAYHDLNSQFTEDDYYGTANPHWECNVAWDVQFNTRPSDAFILVESAMNMPGANYEPREMQGSNLIQMRNDSEMGKAVDAIFKDGLGKEYFQTKKR